MQTIYIRNGERFNINRAEQEIDGQTVPQQAIRENMAKYGVSEIQIEDRKDDRFYFVNELQAAPYIEQTAKPLDQCRDIVWQHIKTKRDALTINGGCHLGNYWFHTDEYSKLQQLALKVQGVVGTIPWKTMDGTFAPVDQATIEQLTSAQVERDTAIFTVAETHRAAIAQLTDVEAIRTYDFSTGWPQSYDEWKAEQP